jgi:hypothetical protein
MGSKIFSSYAIALLQSASASIAPTIGFGIRCGIVEIDWTQHAEKRQQEWEKPLGISRAEVEAVLSRPEQIVPDDEGVMVAQSRRGNGLLRIPYAEVGVSKRILTVYWTNQVKRYWQEEETR